MRPVCIVSGGAFGLGRELIAALSSDNQVIALDIDTITLPVVADKFGCDYRICDVSRYSSVINIVKKYSQIDILINCAGIYLDGELADNDPKKIEQTILVNSLGPINMCRAVIPVMKKQKQGIIINIDSLAGLRPRSLCSVYHASKYALTGFGQSLALELEPFGIKVVNIYPDLMNTDFSKHAAIKRDFGHALDPGEVVKLVKFILSLDPHTTLPDVSIRGL